jgi:hypothetical protein
MPPLGISPTVSSTSLPTESALPEESLESGHHGTCRPGPGLTLARRIHAHAAARDSHTPWESAATCPDMDFVLYFSRGLPASTGGHVARRVQRRTPPRSTDFPSAVRHHKPQSHQARGCAMAEGGSRADSSQSSIHTGSVRISARGRPVQAGASERKERAWSLKPSTTV